MALVGEDDGWPPLVLATLHQRVDVIHQADVGYRQLVLVAVLGEHAHLEDGHVGIRPQSAGAVEEMRGEAAGGAEMPQGVGHVLTPLGRSVAIDCKALATSSVNTCPRPEALTCPTATRMACWISQRSARVSLASSCASPPVSSAVRRFPSRRAGHALLR